MPEKKIVFETPWFNIEAVENKEDVTAEGRPLYRVNTQDGVLMIVVTKEEKLILVQQFEVFRRGQEGANLCRLFQVLPALRLGILGAHVVDRVLLLVIHAWRRWIVQQLGHFILLTRQRLHDLSQIVGTDDQWRIDRIEVGQFRHVGERF